MDRLVEMRLDQGGPQNVSGLLVGQGDIEVIIETRSTRVILELTNGAEAAAHLDHVFTAGLRNEVPEAFARHVIERQRDIAPSLLGHDPVPVPVEQVEQPGIQFDHVVVEPGFREEVEDGEQEKRLVGRRMLRLRRVPVLVLVFSQFLELLGVLL